MLSEPSLGTQLQIHPGPLPRPTSRDAASTISEAQSAALRGASLAFRRTSNPLTLSVNTYSGTNGALAAAASAGSIKQSPNDAHRLAGGDHENTSPLTAAQRSMARENMRKDINSTTSSKLLGENVSTAKSSPSNIAAVLASGKDSRGRQQMARRDGHIRHSKNSIPILRHEVRSSELRQAGAGQDVRTHVLNDDHHRQDNQIDPKISPRNSVVETDHVAPTASLIQLFERSGRDYDNTHNSAPNYTVASPAILSPKPVRPLSVTNTPLVAALAAAQTLSYRRKSDQDTNPNLQSDGSAHLSSNARTMSVKPDPNRISSEPAHSEVVKSMATSFATDSPNSSNTLVGRTRSQEAKSAAPSTAMSLHRKGTPSSSATQKAQALQTTGSSSAFNSASPVDTQKPPLHRAISSFPSITTTSEPLLSPSREESRSNVKMPYQSPSVGSNRTNDSPFLNTAEQRLLPRRSMTSLMTESSLADAIVASSLASSRAPSPSKRSKTPLARRRSRSRHMFQHHRRNSQLDSRTPSPPKTMRHTMRKSQNPDDEDDDLISSRRRKKSNFLNKHPNKHHEGARKRWRDVVTERERKRYEGVWAANKGIYVSVDSFPIKTGPSHHQLSSLAAESVVLNLVVRDIWSRSRLGNEVLEEIWDLVDRKGLGLLDREEFVVGMWLIDQRLKGRKLPVKVSMSVWESVRALSGIKIPKRKT